MELDNISLYIPSISKNGPDLIEIALALNKLTSLFNAYLALIDLIKAIQFINSIPVIN